MRGWIVALLIGLIAARPASAGAWLREDARGFLALSGTLIPTDPGLAHETSLYTEYGLTARLTLGLDSHQKNGAAGHVLGFVRLPLGRSDGRTRAALELAAGAHMWRGDWHPMARTTLSLGRGFSSRRGDGWVNVDAGFEQRFGLDRPAFKLDAALGLSSGPRFRPLLKIETTRVPGHALYWTLTPSLMIDTEKSGTWVIGVERKSQHARTGLRVGLWRGF